VGLTHDVYVFNFVAAGTIEEAILEVLDAKINMFELHAGGDSVHRPDQLQQ